MATTNIMSRSDLSEATLSDIARACRVDNKDIEDVYACTPIQLGMMADYTKRGGTYVFSFVAVIGAHIDIDRYCAAIQTVVSREAILRTRLVECEHGILQVVIRETHHTYRAPSDVDLEAFLAQHRNQSMNLAEPLLSTAVVDQRLVVSTHHSISDQWTTLAMLEDVATVYQGRIAAPRDPFKNFVSYCNNAIEQEKACQFWSARLHGLPSSFPQIHTEGYLPNPTHKITHNMSLEQIRSNISSTALLPSYIEAAWALTVWNYTGDTNISYGMVLSGRTPASNRQTMGPTLVTVPVSVNLKVEDSIRELLKQRTRERRQLQSNPAMWYGLAKIRSINEETKQACQFQTLLNILLTGDIGYSTDELTVESKDAHAPFALCLMFHLTNQGSLGIHANSDPDIIESQQVQRLLNQFEHNLRHIANDPAELVLNKLPQLNPNDWAELLDWNKGLDEPLRECLQDRFIANAQRWPHRMAVECYDGCATYAKLDSMTNRIAHDLKRKGVVVGSPVVFLFDKSFWTVVAVVSIIKAGGIVVPIDTEVPRERMEAILELSRARLILTSPIWHQRCGALGWPEMIVVDNGYVSDLPEAEACPSTGLSPDDVAYLQFTSGSTGVPKGVLLEHRGLVYGQTKVAKPFRWEGEFRILQFASHAWNVCCLDIWGALRFGGTICIPSQDDRLSNLAGFIAAYRVTWALLTPTVIATLSPEEVPTLQTLISGGEPVDPKAATSWGSRLRFINIWCPSESGWNMTWMHLHPKSRYTDTIGKPIGCGIWLTRPGNLDELAPIGSVGEVLIEGAGVARGYAHNPVQTAAAFIPAPAWAPQRSEKIAEARRYYRTGDLARYYPDGSVAFVGRGDNQVKIRGQRFELGEVDFVLGCCESVRSVYAQVLTLEGRSKELVAVLSLADGNLPSTNVMQELSGSDRDQATQHVHKIRETIQEKLPSYMVPSAWFVVEKMPLAATCKLDRALIRKWLQNTEALAKSAIRVQQIIPVSASPTAPETEKEQVLQAVWSTVLGIPEESIGKESSFIQLGGDSILAMLAASRCRKRGFALKAIMLLRNVTLAAAARLHMTSLTTNMHKDGSEGGEDYENHDGEELELPNTDVMSVFGAISLEAFLAELGLREADVEAMYPCLPLQNGILVSQLSGEGWEYMNRFAFKITSKVDQDSSDITQTLLNAWQNICDAQPALRTTFTDRVDPEGRFHQIVLRRIKVELPTIINDSRGDAVEDSIRGYPRPTFKAGEVPHRLLLFKDSYGCVYALLDISHALIDARTMDLLRAELHRACTNPLTPLSRNGSLSKYTAWMERHRESSQQYWRSQLSGTAPCIIASRSNTQPGSETRRQCAIPFNDFEKLRYFSKTNVVTVANIVQLAWSVVLRLVTGNESPCFGFTYSARDAVSGAQDAMGPFLSMLVCRSTINSGDKVITALEAAKEDTAEAMAHPACSLSDLHEFLKLGTSPLFDTLVVIVNQFENEQDIESKYNIEPLLYEDPNEYPLGFKVGYTKDSFRIWLEYRPSHLSDSLVSHVARTLASVLKEILGNDPDQTLDELVRSSDQHMDSPHPFSLLPQDEHFTIKKKAAAKCEISKTSVQDIFPCSPTQTMYISRYMSLSNKATYWFSHVITPTSDISFDRLCQAMDVAESAIPALRTRIIYLEGYEGLLQVIHKPNPTWMDGDDLTEYLESDADIPVRYGAPLCRFGRIEQDNGSCHIVMSLHAAICDERTLEIISDTIEKAYQGSERPKLDSLSRLIDFTMHRRRDNLGTKDEVNIQDAATWPIPTSQVYPQLVCKDSKKELRLKTITDQNSNKSMEMLLQAAWVLCLSRRTGSSKVAFALKLQRHDCPDIPGGENMTGPTSIEALCSVDVAEALNYGSLCASIRDSVQNSTRNARFPSENDTVNVKLDVNQLIGSVLEINISSPASGKSNLFQRLKTTPELQPETTGLKIRCQVNEKETIIEAIASGCLFGEDNTLLLHQYEQAILQLSSSNESFLLSELESLSAHELSLLVDWNRQTPNAIQACIHEQFRVVARQQPDRSAVCSWDHEDLSYAQLDSLSDRLAHILKHNGVQVESVVPFFCEKSGLAPIFILGILKAGGTMLPLDPTHPVERLVAIVEDCGAALILNSSSTSSVASRMPKQAITVTFEALTSIESERLALNDVGVGCTPSNACYIVYTSGSTGVPKGIVVCHQNAATYCHYFQQRLGLTPETRALHVFNLIFDGSIGNIFGTLLAGGAICMPSDQQLYENMGAAVKRFDANFTSMTPTQSTLLRADDTCGTLATLALGGELLTARAVKEWAGRLRLINIYGPSETTIWSSSRDVSRDGGNADPRNIGRAAGCRYWIVQPDDSNRLVPIGCPGELLIEGPLVARGYLHDPKKTSAVFLDTPPKWTSEFPDLDFSQQQFFKSGDLVVQELDGSVLYLNRKDTQVKLRGQRIELGEIEAKAEDLGWNVVAVLVQDEGQEQRHAYLAIFFTTKDTKTDDEHREGKDNLLPPMPLEAATFRQKLATKLPKYMVPDIYFHLRQIPFTASGKTDRASLRKIAQNLTPDQVAVYNVAVRPLQESTPQNHTHPKPEGPLLSQEEQKSQVLLKRLWASVLPVGTADIKPSESFFRLGGNSVAAIHLTAAARDEGHSLSPSQIFQHQTLQDQAKILIPILSRDENLHITPFSLLSGSADITRKQAALFCNVNEAQIEDIFPCTPLQEGLIAMSYKRPGDYVAQLMVELDAKVNIERLRQAWNSVVQRMPMLRTRIVDLGSEGLVQVILQPEEKQSSLMLYNSIQEASNSNAHHSTVLGVALNQMNLIITEGEQSETHLLWTAHHSIYDGWILPEIFKALENAYYNKQEVKAMVPYQRFVKHSAKALQNEAATKFWQDQFAGLDAEPFPTLPTQTYQPRANTTVEHQIPQFDEPEGNFTRATAIRAAWALLQASYTNTSDVIFGAVVSGRQAKVPGIDRVAGATIATVPVRVAFDSRENTIDQYLSTIQKQALDMIDFEHMGLQNIQRVSSESREACRFQTLLLVQPEIPHDLSTGGLYRKLRSQDVSDADAFKNFSHYGLLVVCQQREHALNLQFIFDSNIIEQTLVSRISRQFGHLLGSIHRGGTQSISSIMHAGPDDLETIWRWNDSIPPPVESCTHELIGQTMIRQPMATAICAWDGELTYGELDTLSSHLAHHLVTIGVGPESIVALCLEKSMWMPVATLAVMRAGGVSVAVDVTLPRDRLLAISQQSAPIAVVTSALQHDLAGGLANGVPIVSINRQFFEVEAACQVAIEKPLPVVLATNRLYICFTSGSTGSPKGVQITHGNFSSALKHQRTAIGLTSESRVFDFASYSVDMSWYNLLHTLYAGACLCVPSQDERLHDISGSIQRLKANWICITPTVAGLIDEQALENLTKIELYGELGNADLFSRLQNSTHRLRSAYGPTEATGLATGIVNANDHTNIGRGVGSATWIVGGGFPGFLVPVGGIGELWIEGPLVGLGYLNDKEKTTAAFVENPSWLNVGFAGISGRTGRMYRTGDLARYNEDGTLTFMGRNDEQVKIHGQRVELLEVEHHLRRALREHSSSNAATEVIVEAIKVDDENRKSIVVFLVPNGAQRMENEELTAAVSLLGDSLHTKLRQVLPNYMLPEVYVPLARMPTALTSKRDRQKLRQIGAAYRIEKRHRQVAQVVKAANDEEATLCQIWSDILRIPVDQISTETNFFDLGGDSVSAMRIASRCRQNNISMSIERLMSLQTIKKLAIAPHIMESDRSSEVNGANHVHKPNGINGIDDLRQLNGTNGINGWHHEEDLGEDESFFELSPIQKFYFETEHTDAGNFFVLSRLVSLPKSITQESINMGLTHLVSRHPMLRARFRQDHDTGTWTQRISSDVDASLLSRHVVGEDEGDLNMHMLRCIGSLDIEKGSLIASITADDDLDKDTKLLFIVIHHVVADMSAMQTLLQELDTILTGESLSTHPPASYRQWTISEAEHARNNLSPEVALPGTLVQPSQLSYWNLNTKLVKQRRYAEHRLTINSDLSNAMLGWCNRVYQTQPVELITAALMHSFKLVFPDRALPPCFNVGLGRDTWDGKLDMSQTVGWFSHMAPIQLDDNACTNVTSAIENAKIRSRSLPRRGASYFLSRYHHPVGKEVFKTSAYEVELNFQATFNRDDHSMMLLRSREIPSQVEKATVERFVPWTVFAILVPPVDAEGRLNFVFDYLTPQETAECWIMQFEQSMREIETLARLRKDSSETNQLMHV